MERAALSRMVVKVCGLTRPEDIRAAAEAGVDWLGFNLWPKSRRAQSAEQVRSLVAAMPAGTRAVGIFVDARPEEVHAAAVHAGLHAVQLHGREAPGDWRDFPFPIIKALKVDRADALAAAEDWACEALLLDGPGPDPGGNGVPFVWEQAQALAARRNVLVAGGLTPENVATAIRAVRPAGVDVAGGVESAAGIKDAERMRRFVDAARRAVS